MDMFSNWQEDLYKEIRYIPRASGPPRLSGSPTSSWTGLKEACVPIIPSYLCWRVCSLHLSSEWKRLENQRITWKFYPRGVLKGKRLQNCALPRLLCCTAVVPQTISNKQKHPQDSLADYWCALLGTKDWILRRLECQEVLYCLPSVLACLLW